MEIICIFFTTTIVVKKIYTVDILIMPVQNIIKMLKSICQKKT